MTLASVADYVPRKRCGSHKGALEVLGRRMRHDGRAQISYRQLAERLGVCREQARNILQDLAHQGLLLIEHQRDPEHGNLANVYRLLLAHVLRMIDGEQRRSHRGRPNASDAAALASAPPADEFIAGPAPPPWIFAAAEVLDHHPSQ